MKVDVKNLCKDLPEIARLWTISETLFETDDLDMQVSDEEIFSEVARYVSKTTWLKPLFLFSIFTADAYCYLSFLKPFRHTSIKQKNKLFQQWANTPGLSYLLRTLTFPFKASYVTKNRTLKASNTTYGKEPPAHIEQERWHAQFTDAKDCLEDEELEVDVVVVGSGAGGAAAAYKLACDGHAVLIIEEGHYYNRKDFTGKNLEIFEKIYRNSGLTFSFGNTPILIPTAKCVGGTTTINSGTCFRVPDRVLKEWQQEGLSSITSENLEPFFLETEEMLQVEPSQERYIQPLLDTIKKGAKTMGLREVNPLPRNAPACDGQGVCVLGCPTDAKRSANISFIPSALNKGAYLYTGFKVEKLLRKGDTITGVLAKSVVKKNGRTVKLRINAQKVILALGTLNTPQFLRDNGVNNSNIGKNLSIHPAGMIAAYFKDVNFKNQVSIPQGVGLEDLAQEGIMMEGGTLPPLAYGITTATWGREYVEKIKNYNHTAFFGMMVKDESRGQVHFKVPGDYPLIQYQLNKVDQKKYMKGLKTIAKIFLKAGADEIYLLGHNTLPTLKSENEVDAFFNSDNSIQDIVVSAWHPLGTARMAQNVKDGVVDENNKVFGHKNLYLVDGSTIPSSLGVNPQITIMSMALRAATHIGSLL